MKADHKKKKSNQKNLLIKDEKEAIIKRFLFPDDSEKKLCTICDKNCGSAD